MKPSNNYKTNNYKMKQLILILGIFCGTMGFAQELPPIQLDRPDQTETPYTVPSGHFQFESGLFFEKANKEEQNLLLPTVLSKYGVNDRFELRLITEISSNNIQGNLGLNPVEIGFKTRLLEEKGTIPMTSFIGHVQIPKFSSPNRKGNHFAPSFRFVMQHTLNPKMSLSYNLGAEWDGENPEATFNHQTGGSLQNAKNSRDSFCQQNGQRRKRCI
ncbi:MAG: hypothetical protein C4K58_06270 [Flavobacteriaceae bacterium]|nr:MAG: hypothetical protein C4K58_06270 [Flavobacteriaceae bacterium]